MSTENIPQKRRFLSKFGWAWMGSIVFYIVLRQYPQYFLFLPINYYETLKTLTLWFAIILFLLYMYDERWFRPS